MVEQLRRGSTEKITILNALDIVKGSDYVIIGGRGGMHGSELSPQAINELIDSLEDVEALKMEGDEETSKYFHPMSAETLTRASMVEKPVSYFPESKDGHDIGYYLLQYGLSEEIVELSVPCMRLRRINESSDRFLHGLPHLFELHKPMFSFIDTERGLSNFLKVLGYWENHQLDVYLLDSFAYDFEGFMGQVREHEFWEPDLVAFRRMYKGKVGVSCGSYHADFVESVLEGRSYEKPPSWETHFDVRRKRDRVGYGVTLEQLREAYVHINATLKPV